MTNLTIPNNFKQLDLTVGIGKKIMNYCHYLPWHSIHKQKPKQKIREKNNWFFKFL